MRGPNFFLVGAPKSGTTSLMRYLDQHPDVATASVKEPCFFAPEVPASRGITRGWHEYLALYSHVRRERAVGEGSVAYLASPNAAAAIAARVPDARILMLLRDPADRLFAHYSAYVLSTGSRQRFEDWLVAAGDATRPGFYAEHLARFRSHFPAERVFVGWHDDFTAKPARVLQSIFAFLNVDPDAPIDLSQRYNETTVPRWGSTPIRRTIRPLLKSALAPRTFERIRRFTRKPGRLEPSPQERARGIALYSNDIRRLQSMTGRDLSHWL